MSKRRGSGSAGAQDGQEGPPVPEPTQPPIPAEEPRDAPIPAEDGTIPGPPPKDDAGLVWTEPPVPLPEAGLGTDAGPEPELDASLPDASLPDASLPDAAVPPDAAPSGCAGYQRIHVAIGTCVRAVNCAGCCDTLIGIGTLTEHLAIVCKAKAS